MIARILSIAGSDSGGGAGIQADLKTITMLGGHAMTAITAITAQNTVDVTQVMLVPPGMVIAQIDAVMGDIGVDAIKIGMIGSPEATHEVIAAIAGLHPIPIVFDPVMISTSGAMLADRKTIETYREMMKHAVLVTPNLPELAVLANAEIGDIGSAVTAARALASEAGTAVLVKGGHGASGIVTDILIAGEVETRWCDTRIETRHSHGTGCTLSSAIATGLGQGMALADAIGRAREYVRMALMAAPGLGRGHGPMGHGPAI